MVKTVLALEKGLIPPNYDFRAANKDIPLKEWNLKVPTSVQAWPDSKLQRASINNFGFGGTNVHVILEKYKATQPGSDPFPDGHAYINKTRLEGDQNGASGIPSINGHGSGNVTDSPMPLAKPKLDLRPSALMKFCSPKRQVFVLSANDKASLRTRIKQLGMLTVLDLHSAAVILFTYRAKLMTR